MCSLKVCSKCSLEKELSEFQKDRTKIDGYYSSCKVCNYKRHTARNERMSTEKKELKEIHNKKLFNSETKLCCSCRELKPKSEFHRRSDSADGVVASCKSCKKKYHTIWYEENKDHHRQVQGIYKQNPKVRERRRHLGRTKYRANKAYNVAMRRAIKRQATPPWLTKEQKDEIKNFYRIAKHMSEFHEEKFEVDHIEPLIGKNSTGLMVPWNLQVIPALDNRKKSNKIITE